MRFQSRINILLWKIFIGDSAPRRGVIGFILASGAGLAVMPSVAADQDYWENSKIKNSAEVLPNGVKYPQCSSINARTIPFRSVRIENSHFIFLNDEGEGVLRDACIGNSVSFNRYLMQDMAWLSESQRRMAEQRLAGGVRVAAHILIYGIEGRDMQKTGLPLSFIGEPRTFPGAVFTRWEASAWKVSEFNKVPEMRSIDSSARWSINGTMDDRTKKPIAISCVQPATSHLQEDQVYLAAARQPDDTAGKSTGNCSFWFGVDVPGDGRVLVKVALGGQTHLAAEVVKRVREEIKHKVRGEK
ncbi:hypothetical protein [Roseateles sp.]|uniref:hypothetical protein n=1 Tax=Roseateles sp. TaxID=1971397 RepID=UPI0031DAEBBD